MSYLIDGFLQALTLIISLDPEVVSTTELSLFVSGVATILAATVGIPLGIWISLSKFPLKGLVRSVINTLMGLPPVVVGLLILLMVSRAGPLGTFGILFTPAAMVVAQFILVTPIVTGLTVSAATAVDRSIIETAVSLGARRAETLMVVLSESRQALLTAVIAGFGRAVAEVGAVMIVGGDIQWSTRVLTTSIVLNTRNGYYDKAIAMGVILLLVALVINVIVFNLEKIINYIQAIAGHAKSIADRMQAFYRRVRVSK